MTSPPIGGAFCFDSLTPHITTGQPSIGALHSGRTEFGVVLCLSYELSILVIELEIEKTGLGHISKLVKSC